MPGAEGFEREAVLGAGTLDDLVFTPDGATFVTAGSLGVQEWATDTLEIVRRYPVFVAEHEPGAPIERMACSPDGRWLAVWAESGKLHMIDRDSGDIALVRVPVDVEATAVALRFSPDSTRLLAADRRPAWIDLDTLEVHELDGVLGRPVGFAADDSLMVVTERSLAFVAVDRPQAALREVELPLRRTKVDVSADGRYALAFCASRSLVIDVTAGDVIAEVAGEGYLVGNGLVFRGGRPDEVGRVKLWLSPLHRELPFFPESGQTSLEIIVSERFAISPTLTHALEYDAHHGWLWLLDDDGDAIRFGRFTSSFEGGILGAVAGPALERVVVVGGVGAANGVGAYSWAQLWDLVDATPIGPVDEQVAFGCTLPSVDRLLGQVVVPSAEPGVSVFDIDTGALVTAYASPEVLQHVATSPDGVWLVGGGRGRDLMLWRAGQPDVVASWPDAMKDVAMLLFTLDGEQVVASGASGVAVIDRAAFFDEGERFAQRFDLLGADAAHRLVLSPSGERLAVTTSHGAFVFDLDSAERLGHWPDIGDLAVLAMPDDDAVVFAAPDGQGLCFGDLTTLEHRTVTDPIAGIGAVVSVCFDDAATRMLVIRSTGEMAMFRIDLETIVPRPAAGG